MDSKGLQKQPQSGSAFAQPREFQFSTSEVFIRKQGNEVILSPRFKTWAEYLESGAVASEDFMEGIEELPMQRHENP